jgi:hypothetical protein
MWEKLIGGLFGTTLEKYIDYKKRKRELIHERELEKIKGKIEYEKALTKRASESEGRDHEWELESIRNSGWKDEFVLIVLSLGMVGVFVPPLQPYVLSGFDALAQTPDWYRWLILTIYAATFGIRIWRRKL